MWNPRLQTPLQTLQVQGDITVQYSTVQYSKVQYKYKVTVTRIFLCLLGSFTILQAPMKVGKINVFVECVCSTKIDCFSSEATM